METSEATLNVSVILITWNESTHDDANIVERHKKRLVVIEECVRTIQKNAGYPIELIVVSSGDAAHNERITRWGEEFEIDKMFLSDHRLGVCPARAIGVGLSCGNSYVFLDDDMYCKEHWLKRAIEFWDSIGDPKHIYLSLSRGRRKVKETETYWLRKIAHDGSLFISKWLYDQTPGYANIKTPYMWNGIMKALPREYCSVVYTPKPQLVENRGWGELRRIWCPEWYLNELAGKPAWPPERLRHSI